MMRYGRLLAMTVLLSTAATSATHAAIEYAEVTGGRLKGKVENGVSSFKGVPFAAPPVGPLRWKVPQPVIAWSGAREATAFAPACIQPWGEDANRPSEDCLYLNVWTAAVTAKERRPVMLWIHGGGLTSGMSWERLSYGTRLAREGVVLVTIAYRLGALGFLTHPDLARESGKGSGNYGLFDMVAALKWVQANIAQFGGDPARVTIFGGSAGGFAVSLLAGAPAATGLYARAIAVGGAGFFPKERADLQESLPAHSRRGAEMIGEAFFRSLGARDLASARALPADAISKAFESKPWSIGATIDGDLVQRSNTELFEEGRFNDTPILIGFTSDEWGDPPAETSAATVQAEIDRLPCTKTHAAIDAAYPHANDAQAKISARYLNRDLHVGWSTWTWARLQTAKGRHRAYVYFFDVHGPEHPFGAPHASEYPYMFGHFPTPPTSAEEATSALLRRYWINFATHGNPNGPGLPVWKPFDEDSQMAMVFASTASPRQLPNLEGLKALDASLQCRGP